MINLKDMSLAELEGFFEGIGEKKFRARQVFGWIYRGVTDFEQMSDISKTLRDKLRECGNLRMLEILKMQQSQTDGTRKYLFGLSDGNCIESVFMKYKYGNSICVSSQAGCRMGCSFCASTLGGLKRNLTPGEIVDQILSVERDTGEKIGNIVVMGTGEPFDNYENLCRFIRLVNAKEGLNLGMRSITLSTCGLVPGIEAFGDDFPQVNLAISLHAPNDAIRSKLMPINSRYPMDQLISACRSHVRKTGRRITFEYALVENVNDSKQHAEELARRLAGIICHVNLIPLNKVEGTGLSGSSREKAAMFVTALERKGITATIRRELGSDISAACGQLRLGQK